MSVAVPLILPHLPSLRSRMEERLSSAANHSDVSHKCALPSCGFRGQQLVEVRRLGRQELHREGDLREEVHEEDDLRQEIHQERNPREAVRPGCCGGGKCNLQ